MSVTKKIMGAINSGIRNAARPQNLKFTAQKLVKDIKERTATGKEVKTVIKNGKGSPPEIQRGIGKNANTNFKGLEPATKRRRRRDKSNGKLSSKTTANKSNQIRTGKMVESLDYTVKPKLITLAVDKEQETKLRQNRVLGRNFLELSRKNLTDIAIDIASFIAKAIERNIN